ncbi:MAG TPA: hypothetical protein VFT40_10300 [Sphingomicrobium sp.]|jgi:hypothetical protein|nr:hypothetical protein [Sphingomicrobium sp.]
MRPYHNVTLVRWQTGTAYRSNKSAANGGTGAIDARFESESNCEGSEAMADVKKREKEKGDHPPAPTLSGEPDQELELKVKKHPEDEDAKVDLGSDESMDASDPISTTQPGTDKPAPSSGFPE